MSNPQWTINSIPLDFEGYHSFLLACAHCRLPLLPLAALDAYLRLRHAPTLQLSAFFLAPADAPALTAYLQLEALEVAVTGPFLLCQVGSIRCRNCGKSVGHRLGRTTPEHRQLADSLLIDLDKLHDSPQHPGLKQSVQEQSELALQTASPSPRFLAPGTLSGDGSTILPSGFLPLMAVRMDMKSVALSLVAC